MSNHAIDLLGRRFERLLVVARAPSRDRARWVCICDCGAEHVVASDALRSGDVRSCGCLRREVSRATTMRNLANAAQRRYRLASIEAVSKSAGKPVPRWRGARAAAQTLEKLWV